MNHKTLLLSGLLALTGAPALMAAAEPARASVTFDVNAAGIPVSPTLHGLFFEDINYAADGGLYAELIQNRSFEHRDPLFACKENALAGSKGSLTIAQAESLNERNTNFLRIKVEQAGGGYGFTNSGFDGISLKAGERYRFSIFTRGEALPLRVLLLGAKGETLAEARLSPAAPGWNRQEVWLTASADCPAASLAVLAGAAGTVDVDMVSLFPEKTFRNRPNGLRADLAQALADLKPGFMRFPGGCIVEGNSLANAYRWKDTVGPVEARYQNANLWSDKQSPDYNQTYGLGFFEFFQLCEDIGAKPVPVLNCGMSCQFRKGKNVPLAELTPWIQDALDLIEFANGPVSTKWGALRASMGHPESFHLDRIAVGNEQWGAEYFERYQAFHTSLAAQAPEIKIISSSGPGLNDAHWTDAWKRFKSGTPADIVDEHYYMPVDWFLNNHDRYAAYSPSGPKIFAGEFAAHEKDRRSTLRAGLAEASFMTGLLRHGDVVDMSSYAPLFAKFDHAQWSPNLIWFNNSQVLLTPSYHVQALFAQNRPDTALPTTVAAAGDTSPSGRIGVGTWNTQAEYKDFRVTSADGKVLYESGTSANIREWQTAGTGSQWSLSNGVLAQKAGGENLRAHLGSPSWSDYPLSLKARKLSGAEGFLIIFQTKDIETPSWWNLGGWGNTAHALDNGGLPGTRVKGTIETNRWYDIRLELSGKHVRAFLDNKLIQEGDRNVPPSLFAAAGLDKTAKDLVVQLVNPFDHPATVTVSAAGLGHKPRSVRVTSLSHADQLAVNTLEMPGNVAPSVSTKAIAGETFEITLPPFTHEVLRTPL